MAVKMTPDQRKAALNVVKSIRKLIAMADQDEEFYDDVTISVYCVCHERYERTYCGPIMLKEYADTIAEILQPESK